MIQNRNEICRLFGIKYPIIQAGMVWVSGGKLAGASASAGVLGIIGAGSMDPELLRSHIRKARKITNNPFGVNLPLLYKRIEEQITVSLEEGVKIFFTSAGSPKKYTKFLKDRGCTVVHVTSTPELAKKCELAGVDAVVAEGFEAGGHNGRDEITTMALIPQVVRAVKIPVIAAGGIANGSQVAAALALGAKGVQIGSRFALTQESSAHQNFKDAILKAGPGDTKLLMKGLVPVRLLKNEFSQRIEELENQGPNLAGLSELLGKGRARAGMLEGNLVEGELEIGQVSGMMSDIPSCIELVQQLISEYEMVVKRMPKSFDS